MIRLREVEKSVAQGAGRLWLLRQIDLDVEQGEFVTVMGPSGAGKSTLLSILGMLDHDWQGVYGFLHEDVHAMKPRDRAELNKRYIGFVFQQYHLLDDLTVAENIELPLSYRDVRKKDREALVADVLDRFNIVGKKDLFPSQLSGGQQQLVAVARAVVGSPKVVLADEPTGALHSSHGKMIMDTLARLNEEGTTVIQVTHNETWARYGSRIIELSDGWLVRPRASTPEHQTVR